MLSYCTTRSDSTVPSNGVDSLGIFGTLRRGGSLPLSGTLSISGSFCARGVLVLDDSFSVCGTLPLFDSLHRTVLAVIRLAQSIRRSPPIRLALLQRYSRTTWLAQCQRYPLRVRLALGLRRSLSEAAKYQELLSRIRRLPDD